MNTPKVSFCIYGEKDLKSRSYEFVASSIHYGPVGTIFAVFESRISFQVVGLGSTVRLQLKTQKRTKSCLLP